MLPVRRLILAIDEQESSARVWREASMLAKLFGAQVIPVHVTMDSSAELPAVASRIGDRLTGPPDLSTTEVHLYRPGSSVSAAILTAAKDHKADLIVLGAGKKSTLDRVFLGSTAEAVSRGAQVPVWVVRPPAVPRELKTVLCAVDGSPAARMALRGAVELARRAEAKLIALAVVSKKQQGADPVLVMEIELREYLKDIDHDGINLWIEVLQGDDALAEILKQATTTECDVLVLGQAGRAGLQRLWNSNTADDLIRTVPCSVLTIHAKNGVPS